jgi:hypothetical protein
MVPVATGIADYSYDRADRILTAGVTPFVVNANGNLTARGAATASPTTRPTG